MLSTTTSEINNETKKPAYLETQWEKYTKHDALDEKNL
jgi:hypothetical protein